MPIIKIIETVVLLQELMKLNKNCLQMESSSTDLLNVKDNFVFCVSPVLSLECFSITG